MSFHRAGPICLSLLSLIGCNSSSDQSPATSQVATTTAAVTEVAVQLNWYPEAEHGGVYQAAADGSYAADQLNVDIRPGGRATPVAAELELGRVHFAFSNADDVVVYRRQGMDIVAVLAAMQNSPRCILVRDDSGADSFDDLAGMTLQRQAGRPFLEFMRSRGILDQVQVCAGSAAMPGSEGIDASVFTGLGPRFPVCLEIRFPSVPVTRMLR